jgi:hypothetical protein
MAGETPAKKAAAKVPALTKEEIAELDAIEPFETSEEKPDPFGRIVRYVTPSETIRPAIVTRVHEDGAVDLTVFNSEGAAPATRVLEEPPVDGDFIPHSFHWPTR